MSSYDAHRRHAMTADRKPGEREKCHQFYCPNHPAWIPAGQNGCPHCAGTATRGFCICETASADEIRDMYTPPAPESEPERVMVCARCDRAKPLSWKGVDSHCDDGHPHDWQLETLSPASETPHDDGCGGCDLGICTPSETPSPEVGEWEAALHDLEGSLPCSDETCICCAEVWPKVQRVLALAAAKETK